MYIGIGIGVGSCIGTGGGGIAPGGEIEDTGGTEYDGPDGPGYDGPGYDGPGYDGPGYECAAPGFDTGVCDCPGALPCTYGFACGIVAELASGSTPICAGARPSGGGAAAPRSIGMVV